MRPSSHPGALQDWLNRRRDRTDNVGFGDCFLHIARRHDRHGKLGLHPFREGPGAFSGTPPDRDRFKVTHLADRSRVGRGLLSIPQDCQAPGGWGREGAAVATALAAAVRMAVISPASTTQTGAPVSGSNRMTSPWCDCFPFAKFSWKTLISFAPNGADAPIAPGDRAIIASRTIGMHTSYVSRRATSSRSMNRIRRFLVLQAMS